MTLDGDSGHSFIGFNPWLNPKGFYFGGSMFENFTDSQLRILHQSLAKTSDGLEGAIERFSHNKNITMDLREQLNEVDFLLLDVMTEHQKRAKKNKLSS